METYNKFSDAPTSSTFQVIGNKTIFVKDANGKVIIEPSKTHEEKKAIRDQKKTNEENAKLDARLKELGLIN